MSSGSDQVNPALTFAMFATRKLNGLRALVYIVAQCLGGFLGAGAVYLAMPSKKHIDGFVNKVSPPPPIDVPPSVLFQCFVTDCLSGPPGSGSPGAERRSGPGHRGSVHLPDGLHRVCSV